MLEKKEEIMYCYVTNDEANIIMHGMPFFEEKFKKDVEVIKREKESDSAESLGEKHIEFFTLKFENPQLIIPVCSMDGQMFGVNSGDIMVDISWTQQNSFKTRTVISNYQQFAVRSDERPIHPYKKIIYIFPLPKLG